MKLLLTIHENEVSPMVGEVDIDGYAQREAARAVLRDANGQVYLLNVSTHGYHKLPGGGIDEGEEIIEALKRELLEEVGCEAEVTAEIGSLVEYREFEKLKQTSYCFLAQQSGQQRESSLEENELAEGMFEVRAADIDAAIELLESDKPDNVEGKFIQRRDLVFLRAAQQIKQ